MIKFTQVTVRNFLAVGDIPNTYLLNKSPTTIITGVNGSGKSLITDAITYGLFGKSFRGLTQAKLVNSVNKKNAEVTIEFKDFDTHYKITRTINPNSLTVWKDGVQVSEAAAVRDFQSYLETHILKFTQKSFMQTCIIGSSNHTPFLELTTANRRELVEQLFGISAFSTMNKLLKAKVSAWKSDLESKNAEIGKCQTSIDHLSQFVQTLTSQVNSSRDDFGSMIVSKQAELDRLKSRALEMKNTLAQYEEKQAELQAELLDPYRLEVIERELSAHNMNIQTIKARMAVMRNDAERLKNGMGGACPSCFQDITEDHVTSCIQKIKVDADACKDTMENHVAQSEPLTAMLDRNRALRDELSQLNTSIKSAKNTLEDLKRQGQGMSKELQDLKTRCDSVDTTSLDRTQGELRDARAKMELLVEQKQVLMKQGNVYQASLELLKDSGIKSLIIKQYLPLLNSRVNHYLQAMNFNVMFEMDENFDDKVTVRNQPLTYQNFSMGERQRMSLAILFAWRDVAAVKGSVAANILFLDETLDASLDEQGTQDLLAIIEDLSKTTNIFVISHKSQMEDRFRSVLRIGKVNGFSKIL